MTYSILRVCVGTLLLLSLPAASSQDEALPRYNLRPGQVLTYQENQSPQAHAPGARYTVIWRLWVTGRNDDGSWRLVARQTVATAQEPGSAAHDETVTFARFDVRSDGEVPACPTLGTRIDPSQFFPRLPGDKQQAAAGWESRDERDDTTTRYQPKVGKDAPTAAGFEFVADRRGYRERIYEGRSHRTFHFDDKRGVIARGETEESYGSQPHSARKRTLELTSFREMAPAELATFRDQMDRYFTTHQAYLKIYRKVDKSGDQSLTLLDQARKLLADARAQVTLPEPCAALDIQLKNHDQFADSKVEEAQRFAKVIGYPAPAWELKDLDGRTHTLEQYRGKVLVLDFWYRGCGWCMRAMPQVKRVAEHYRGRPVAVFGMNNDQNEDDARFVRREMQLDYPVLRSQEMPAKYGCRGFPTVVIIDQQGKVADVHIGYSPQLFEELTEAVDRLLDAK
jgi:thiol-disulfide isomerase/thioredoxin